MNPLQTSVALCSCNGARYLATQLQSVLAQTVRPDEMVICDDASTDESVSIIRNFAAEAPFEVRLLQNEKRLGPAKNFEKAIRETRGEIIFLSDQDDVWKPSKVKVILDVLSAHPEAQFAFSDALMIDDNGMPIEGTLWGDVGLARNAERFTGSAQLETLLKHNIVTGATMAFRGSFRAAALPIAAEWMHDHWIVLLASAVSSGVLVPESQMMYRRHASQVCGWRKKNFWQVLRESLSTQAEDWTKKVDAFRSLMERVALISTEFQCPPDRMKLLKEKELHLSKRSQTRSSSGVSRIAKVLAEAATGRYGRFSDSWYSVVRDL
jgi:glycosyltransferase involved in cell wall biosynthesis